MSRTSIKRNILTIVLYICCSLFMNGFYKILVSFIANQFSDPIVMITMLINYIIPVFCFLFYFYNYYIKKINKVINIIYSAIVIFLSSVTLVLIITNFKVYASNNALGVYGAIPSIIVTFPYDGIIVNIILITIQIFNLLAVIKPNNKLAYLKENFIAEKKLKLNLFEYIPICILALLAMLTVGDFISGFNAIENALYNPKYLYLLLWLLIIPTMNLFSYVFKIENKINSKLYKIIYLLILITINILFGLLVLFFKIIDPSFIVLIGKPLFPIAFAISFPIEITTILVIQLIGVIINTAKVIFFANKRHYKIR